MYRCEYCDSISFIWLQTLGILVTTQNASHISWKKSSQIKGNVLLQIPQGPLKALDIVISMFSKDVEHSSFRFLEVQL